MDQHVLIPLNRRTAQTGGSHRLRLLLRQNEAINEELALPSLHCRIAEAAARLVPSRVAGLAIRASDLSVRQLVQCEDADASAVSVLLPDPTLERLTTLLRPLVPGRASRVPAVAALLPEPWGPAVVAVPVHYRRDVLAVLLLAEPDAGLSPADEDVLLSLAVTAGSAIENARLYDEARRRQEWLQEAAEVGNGILGLATEREAIALMARSVQKLADAELVTAWTPGGSHDLVVTSGVPAEESGDLLGSAISATDGLTTEILSSRRGQVLFADERPDCGWLATVERAGIGPLMIVPMAGGNGPRGLLLAGRRHGRPPFSDTDLDMAETFADHMAVALDRIDARAAQQRLSLLEDRERIARDLHDHVIQLLFATGLKLQTAERVSTDAAVRPRLAEAVRDLDATIRQLRTTIFRLADETAAARGLRTAVLEVLAEVAPVLPYEPQVEFQGPVDTTSDPELVTEVVAVVREAATNSGKHAQASRLEVRVEAEGGRLTLTIEDDGVGLGRSNRRSGLANLHQRALHLGGDLALEVPAGGGTRLRWSVPLPD